MDVTVSRLPWRQDTAQRIAAAARYESRADRPKLPAPGLPHAQQKALGCRPMENTTTQNGEESETEIVSTAVSEPEIAEPEQPEELAEFDDGDDDGAELVGAGVLASPALLLSGKTPGWARATALGGLILGAIGLLLAILAWFNIIAPGLTAPPAAAG